MTACEAYNIEAIEVLLTQEEVDAALCDENNCSALHLAAMHDASSVVRLLLEKGCPSDVQDSEVIIQTHIQILNDDTNTLGMRC